MVAGNPYSSGPAIAFDSLGLSFIKHAIHRLTLLDSNRSIDPIYFHLSTVTFVLLVVSLYSFYPHYLGVLRTPMVWHIHVHYVLMVIWMAMLIAQPFLIRTHRYALHRKLGTVSYVLVPILMVFAFMMIQFGYDRMVAEYGAQPGANPEQANYRAAQDIGLGFISLFAMIVFYPMAMLHRKRPALHARYMVGVAMSLVGPILDRAIYLLADAAKLPSLKYEYASFFLIDITLLLLLLKDYHKALPLVPNLTILIFFIMMQFGYAFGLSSPAWQWFVGALLSPV